MSLGRLVVRGVRNISDLTLELSPGVNLFSGPNGSGKTSLLESVHFLGSGRSFRSVASDPLISRDRDEAVVFGEVSTGQGRMALGVQRDRQGGRTIRVNGETIDRSSELARRLPTLFVGPDTVELITGPPSNRRSFLNWGVFHVEHGFSSFWQMANRALRQRNQLLRTPGVAESEILPWTEQLCSYSDEIHRLRQQYFEKLSEAFHESCRALNAIENVQITYNKGWEGDDGLRKVLDRQFVADLERGYTYSGVHRADIRVRLERQPVAEVCSRGELKVLAWALVLAQGTVFSREGGTELLYLVDDLPAELDSEHRQCVARLLMESKSQVLVTGIDKEQLLDGWKQAIPTMFHVEHGGIRREER